MTGASSGSSCSCPSPSTRLTRRRKECLKYWGWMSDSAISPRWRPWTTERSSPPERRSAPKRTITPACKNDFSEKALARPHGVESPSARQTRRLKLNTNHTISKRILDTHPQAFIGLEELSGIRDRTKRKHGKKATKRQRRANRHASKWAFTELHGLLAYKAALAGSLCIKVDADYTSQACPRCGYTSRQNRPGQGLLFVCQQCHYTLHADLVGSRNIALQNAGHPARLGGHGAVVRCP